MDKKDHGFKLLEKGDGNKSPKEVLEKFNEFIIENHDDLKSILILASTGTDKKDTSAGFIYNVGYPAEITKLFAIMFQQDPFMLEVMAVAIVTEDVEKDFHNAMLMVKLKKVAHLAIKAAKSKGEAQQIKEHLTQYLKKNVDDKV